MNSNKVFRLIFLFNLIILIKCFDLKGFDDTILYNIKFFADEDKGNHIPDDSEYYTITSNDKETYQCIIPSLIDKENEESTIYTGPSPLELLSPLFISPDCSYRIETYWTYQICHGNYIKQYHEEREGKVMKTQEYYLGKWSKQQMEDLKIKMEKSEHENEKLKYKKIDGINLPYVELEMTDGTLCDLNNEPRTTKIFYVCHLHGKNEIYSLKETSTCNYEVVVLTPTLCSHPKFRPHNTGENLITCIPKDGAPSRPKSLLAMEVENYKSNIQRFSELQKGMKDNVAAFKVVSKDGTVRLEILQSDALVQNYNKQPKETVTKSPQQELNYPNLVNDAIKDYLSAKLCLVGGTGWWKYEFCYGRFVRQFHNDVNGESSLILGFFNEDAHNEWLEKNPHKKPKPVGKRNQLTHFYQEGTVCDKTGKKRQTEVKLKCSANISLYLLEPQTCQYILVVEAPINCNIIDLADERGLINDPNLVEKVNLEEDLHSL